MYNVYNEPATTISINFIVPSVNHFSCWNFDELKLSENYLDNLDKMKNIIYNLDKKISRVRGGYNGHCFRKWYGAFI